MWYSITKKETCFGSPSWRVNSKIRCQPWRLQLYPLYWPSEIIQYLPAPACLINICLCGRIRVWKRGCEEGSCHSSLTINPFWNHRRNPELHSELTTPMAVLQKQSCQPLVKSKNFSAKKVPRGEHLGQQQRHLLGHPHPTAECLLPVPVPQLLTYFPTYTAFGRQQVMTRVLRYLPPM